MKVDKTTIGLVSVAIVLLLVLFFVTFIYGNENVQWEKFKLDNIQDSIFAIMIEQDDGSYKEADNAIWPGEGYKYNSSISGCVDINGEMIPGALKYDPKTNIAEVNSEYTSYCYLYFDMPATNLYDLCKTYNNIDECIKEESSNLKFISDIWDSSLEDDGYRYIGTYPDNYICFGTTDKDTCIDNTDKYMYRIIGIFQDSIDSYHLKLIKKETLNNTYQWHNAYKSDTDWNDSDLYNGLNGTYFLTNSSYNYLQNSLWLSKITEWQWTATNTLTDEYYNTNNIHGINYRFSSVSVNYLHELNRSGKSNQTCYYSTLATAASCEAGEWKEVVSKIGLIYVSDFMLSLGSNSLGYINSSDYNKMKTGWLHLSQNDTAGLSTTGIEPPSANEWTLSRYGDLSKNNTFMTFNIQSTGEVYTTWTHYEYSVRPAFYLNSSIKIFEGKGTQTEPYLIG
ncbi:MAG: hypothetical protein IJY87_00380 [Bacilli bacterium]|nr:hypothetical protein [Bacilli bacterium]